MFWDSEFDEVSKCGEGYGLHGVACETGVPWQFKAFRGEILEVREGVHKAGDLVVAERADVRQLKAFEGGDGLWEEDGQDGPGCAEEVYVANGEG